MNFKNETALDVEKKDMNIHECEVAQFILLQLSSFQLRRNFADTDGCTRNVYFIKIQRLSG